MTLPLALPRVDAHELHRVSAFHAGVRILSFLADGIEMAVRRAAFLAPRYEVVEISVERGEVVAAWRDGRRVESK